MVVYYPETRINGEKEDVEEDNNRDKKHKKRKYGYGEIKYKYQKQIEQPTHLKIEDLPRLFVPGIIGLFFIDPEKQGSNEIAQRKNTTCCGEEM